MSANSDTACIPQLRLRHRSSFLVVLLQLEAWALLILMLVKYVGVQQFTTLGVDFPKHYWAAIEVLNGRNPYDGDLYLGFNYPLFTAWIYLFLATFSLETAGVLWDICNTLYVVGALVLIILCYRPKINPQSPQYLIRFSRYWPSIAAFIFAIYASIFLEIRDGNIEPLNLFLLVALGAALLHNRDKTAGILLAVLCLVKILPLFFLPGLFLGGKRRTVYSCLIFLAVYGLVLLLTGWWRWEWFLFTQTLPNVGYHYQGFSNSLAAQAGFYLFPEILQSPRVFSHTTIIISLAILTIYCVILLMSYLRSRRFSSLLSYSQFPLPYPLALSFSSLTIVLIAPLLEYQHLIWAIPAYLFLIRGFLDGRVSGRLFSVSFGLWLLIFASRYWADLAKPSSTPLHISTWLLVALWLISGLSILPFAIDRTGSHRQDSHDCC